MKQQLNKAIVTAGEIDKLGNGRQGRGPKIVFSSPLKRYPRVNYPIKYPFEISVIMKT